MTSKSNQCNISFLQKRVIFNFNTQFVSRTLISYMSLVLCGISGNNVTSLCIFDTFPTVMHIVLFCSAEVFCERVKDRQEHYNQV
jgi:hypothetical protein